MPLTRRLQEFEGELTDRCVGSPISVCKTEAEWRFKIGATTHLGGYLIWRLIGPERIELCSEDDGHQFGQPAPIDAVRQFNDLVVGSSIAKMSLDPKTGDLMLALDNHLILQVLVTSSGYECWRVHDDDEFLGAGCSGGIV